MSGGLALARIKEADEAVRRALVDVAADGDAHLAPLQQELDDQAGAVEDLRQRVGRTETIVEDLRSRLTDSQVAQVGDIVEDYLRTLDEKWLGSLRNAIRVVVSGQVQPATSRAVLAYLRTLSPTHIIALEKLWTMTKSTSAFVSVATADPAKGRVVEVFDAETEATLVACGFIEHQRSSGGLNDFVTDRTFRITALGVAALRLLSDKT